MGVVFNVILKNKALNPPPHEALLEKQLSKKNGVSSDQVEEEPINGDYNTI